MTSDLSMINQNLGNAPAILENLLGPIPKGVLKEIRKVGKWPIHSHVCHLSVAQPMLLKRFDEFLTENKPVFVLYFPDKDEGGNDLMKMDLAVQLSLFKQYRSELLKKIKSVNGSFWEKMATHPEYEVYTPYIMIRHIMLHDYLHMYRIEELWLTNPEYV